MKNTSYKKQLEQELNKNNLIITFIDSNSHWWDEEHWKVEDKFDTTKSFYICFIVDPMYEGNGEKGQYISEIKATSKFPENNINNDNLIASFCKRKGKFEDKLKNFILELKEVQNK